MLSESLRVPYRADDAFGTIVVGSVLTLLAAVLLTVWSVLLVVWPPVGLALTLVAALPSLVMRGYLLRVVTGGIRGESTVSSFVRWGSLLRAGSKSALLSAIYFLPGAVLCGLAVGGGVATAISPSGFDETAQALTGVLILVSGFGLLVYGLVYLYVRPAARAVFAATGSVRAALGLRRVGRLAATGDYLTGWLIAMGLLAVGPTLLLPVLVVAAVVGVVAPVVALLIVLVTLLLGVGSAFVFRVSAAWSTGRGAATGLDSLYPDTIESVPETGGTGVAIDDQATPGIDGGSAEVDPTVQTGRTVAVGRSETSVEETTASEATPSTDSTGDDHDRPDDTKPADNPDATKPADHTDHSRPDHDSNDSEPVDHEDDAGFVWGVDDNNSQ